MTLIRQATGVTLTYNLGLALTTVTLAGVSKAGGAFTAPHLGTVTSLGNGWYAVLLDTVDTNTVGALALHFTAAIGTPVDPPAEQVATAPLGLAQNDGSSTVTLNNLVIVTDTGQAVLISSGNVGVPAVQINGVQCGLQIGASAGNAVEVLSPSAAGVAITGLTSGISASGVVGHGAVFTGNGGGNGVVMSGSVGLDVTGSTAASFAGAATGMIVSGGTANGLQIAASGSGDAIFATSSSGNGVVFRGQVALSLQGINIALDCEGGTAGLRAFANAGDGLQLAGSNSAMSCVGAAQAIYISATDGPGVNLNATQDGVDILASAIGVSVFGQAGAGLALQGNTDAIALTPGSGFAVNYGGTEMSLAFAEELLGLADGVETGYTVKQSLRLMLAAMCGKSSFVSPIRIYRDVNDTVNRIEATTDINGQRLTVVLDAT